MNQDDQQNNIENEVSNPSRVYALFYSFFLIPFMIAIFGALFFFMFQFLTYEKNTPIDLLNNIQSGSATKRWQSAFELSNMLDQSKIINKELFNNKMVSLYDKSKYDDPRVRTYLALAMGKTNDPYFGEYLVNGLSEDDNLTFKMKRTQKTCELILERNINITWSTPNGVRADKLTKPLLMLMKKTGCTGLIVGTESGDQDTLNNIVKKDLKLETVIEVAKWCKELKIPLTSFFVIGFPKETKQKIQNTIDFAADLYEKYNVLPLLNVATPLIGTVLYDEVVKDQLLVADLTPHNLSGATQPIHGGGMITTTDFSPDDLKEFAIQLNNRITSMDSNFDVAYHV